MTPVQGRAIKKLDMEAGCYSSNPNLVYTIYCYVKLKCIEDLNFANMVLRKDKRLCRCIASLGDVEIIGPDTYALAEAYYKK